jgi:hypothetical protein
MKPPLNHDQLMEIGAFVADGNKPIAAQRKFELSKSSIYRGIRHYEEQTGTKLIGLNPVAKAKLKRAGKKVPPAPAQMNGGTALAHISPTDDWQRRALDAERRLEDASAELERAVDEAHVLQKLLITVGRTL